MGYSFASTASGRQALCCDNCGKTGQVRKRVCPYTVTDDNSRSVDGRRHVLPYCRPPAVCPKCWTTLKAKVHADCKAGAAKAQAKADARQAKLDAGDLIVLAAWGDWDKDTPQGMTRVCFGGPGGRGERMYLMPAGDYKDGGWLSDYPNAVPVDQASAIDGRSSTGEHEYVEEPDGKYSNLVWASCSCGSWRNVGAVNPVVGRHQHGIHLAEVVATRPPASVQESGGRPGAPEPEVETSAQAELVVTVTRTQAAIGTQIEEAASTLGLTCASTWRDGGFAYQLAGKVMTPSEAADYLLAGGFKEVYGRAQTIVHPDRLAERDVALDRAGADGEADATAEPGAEDQPMQEEPAGAGIADWEARIARLLPFCKQGENYRRAVVEAVKYARMKLETGGDPGVDVVSGEVAAGWRPKRHIALAVTGQPVPAIEPEPAFVSVQAAERVPTQADTPADSAEPQPRRVRGQWAALLAGNEVAV